MTEQAISILFTITVALKVPVIIGLILALIWALFEVGGFLNEWIERRRNQNEWRRLCNDFCHLEPGNRPTIKHLLDSAAAPELLHKSSKAFPSQDEHCHNTWLEQLLQEMEFRAAKRLARIRIGLRVGPVLGLMGTLIPMGPALMSISQGNLAMMSQEFIIVFSTTVAGLLVGALCYVMLIARQYWYAKDLAQAEQLARSAVHRPALVRNTSTAVVQPMEQRQVCTAD